MAKYECDICGYIFDEEKEKVKWDALPAGWLCPDCGVGKDHFIKIG